MVGNLRYYLEQRANEGNTISRAQNQPTAVVSLTTKTVLVTVTASYAGVQKTVTILDWLPPRASGQFSGAPTERRKRA